MPPFLLDTTVLIDASKNREPTLTEVLTLLRMDVEVGVSTVNIAEFFAGLRPGERGPADAFLNDLTIWDVTREIGTVAGTIRYDLARQGRVIQIPDALVAATAVAMGATVVTDNVRDFALAGLTVRRLGAGQLDEGRA